MAIPTQYYEIHIPRGKSCFLRKRLLIDIQYGDTIKFFFIVEIREKVKFWSLQGLLQSELVVVGVELGQFLDQTSFHHLIQTGIQTGIQHLLFFFNISKIN